MLSTKNNTVTGVIRRRTVFAAIFLIVFVFGAVFLQAAKVFAEAPFDGWKDKHAKWINRQTIQFNGDKVYFMDSDPSDNAYVFTYNAPANPACQSKIGFNARNSFGTANPAPYTEKSTDFSTVATLKLMAPQSGSSNCKELTKIIDTDGNGCRRYFSANDGANSWSGCELKVDDPGERYISFILDTDGNIKSINPSQAITFQIAPYGYKAIYNLCAASSCVTPVPAPTYSVYVRQDQQGSACQSIIAQVGGTPGALSNHGGVWALFPFKAGGATTWNDYYNIISAALYNGAERKVEACSVDKNAFFKTYMAGSNGTDTQIDDNYFNGGYYKIWVGDTANQGVAKAAVANSAGTGTVPGGNNSEQKPTCQSSGFSLNWILCPIYNSMTTFTNWFLNSVLEPLLKTPDMLNRDNKVYDIWSAFRIFANIFLLIALLVVVFGQTIGTSVFEAFTFRTFITRLFVVIILINVSIYAMAGFLDIVSIIADGIGKVMTAPLSGQKIYEFSFSGWQQSGIVLAGATGAIIAVASGAVWGGALASMGSFLMVFAVLPLFFGALAVFITVAARRAILVLLTIISPVAAALYALPNTQKYASKFVNATFTTAIVSIILEGIFAICALMSFLAVKTSSGGAASALDGILALIFVGAPLAAGGLAFKLSGSIVARGHEFLSGAGKRAHQGILGSEHDPNSLRNRTRFNFRAGRIRNRAQAFRSLNQASRDHGGIVGAAATRGARLAGWGNPLSAEAELNELEKKRIFATKDSGDDAILNARTSVMETNPRTGARERRTLDGKLVTPAEWALANKFYKTLPAMQAIEQYRETKVLGEEDSRNYVNRFGRLADQEGWSDQETTMQWMGTAFARQDERGELKHGSWSRNPATGQRQFSAVGSAPMPLATPITDHDNKQKSSFFDTSKARVPGEGDPMSLEGGTDNFIQETYNRKGMPRGAMMLSTHPTALKHAKEEYMRRLDNNQMVDVTGRTRALRSGERENADARLRQILEIEKRYQTPTLSEDGKTRQSALHGASPATIAAFEELVAVGAGSASVARLNGEITGGNTYVSTHRNARAAAGTGTYVP